jgi:hypothetical protein
VIAHGLWHWPGDQLEATPPPEVYKVIKAAADPHVGVQPTLRCTYGDLSIFDKSLLDDPRLAEALPRSVVAYLKSDEGKAAQRAMTDEYRQTVANLFGNNVDSSKGCQLAQSARLRRCGLCRRKM